MGTISRETGQPVGSVGRDDDCAAADAASSSTAEFAREAALVSPSESKHCAVAVTQKSARRILFSVLRLGIGIGLLVYLVASKRINISALSTLVAAWPIAIVASALLLLDLALMALRLCWLFRPLGMNLGLVTSLHLTLIGSFFASFLPGRAGGDVARIFYALRENSGRRTEIVSVLLFDRGIGLFAMLLVPLIFIPIFPELLQAMAVRVSLTIIAFLALGMLAFGLLCMFAPAVVSRLAQGLLGFRLFKELVARFLATMHAYSRNPGILMAALGLGLIGNLTGVAIAGLALFAVYQVRLTASLCVLVPIGQIVNSLPLTPGGLGLGETAFDTLFRIVGIRGGAEALLCCRIWAMLVGLLGFVLYLRGFRGRMFSSAARSSIKGS